MRYELGDWEIECRQTDLPERTTRRSPRSDLSKRLVDRPLLLGAVYFNKEIKDRS